MKNKPIRLIIKSNYKDLTPTEKKIADYVLSDPQKVARSTIRIISDDLNIADSTFFQFTRRLGFDGFKEFKISVLSEEKDISANIHEDIKETDDDQQVAKKVFNSSINSLSNTLKLLDMNSLKQAKDIMLKSDVVQFIGVGGSAFVSGDAYHKFLRSPINVRHSFDYHIQLMEASLLTENDCAFIISHTGRSKETLDIAKQLKDQNVKIISLTGHAQSPLARVSDVILLTEADETGYRSEALTSRIAQLSIIDTLLVTIMFHNEQDSKVSLKKVRETIKKHRINNIQE